jgi:small GTP-binding protein
MDDLRNVKLVLLGETAVGKTALVERVSTGNFVERPPSIGGEPTIMDLPQLGVRLKIWDTAGSERYRSLAPMYCRGAMAALIVFDVSTQLSFQALAEWARVLRESAPLCRFGIIGNKADLPNHEVSYEDGDARAKDLGAAYYLETSALTGQNVSAAFQKIAQAGIQPSASDTIRSPFERVGRPSLSKCC